MCGPVLGVAIEVCGLVLGKCLSILRALGEAMPEGVWTHDEEMPQRPQP